MGQAISQMLNEKQAASVLSVSVAALRRWRREGRGPGFVRLERCIRYDLRTLESFLQERSSTQKIAADRESAAEREVRLAHATTRT